MGEGACAATGGVRARERRRAPDNPPEGGCVCRQRAAAAVMRGRFGRARPLTCSPYITPKSPERGGRAWDFCGLGTFSRAASGILRSLPTPQAPGTAPIRLGNWGGTQPRAPLPVPGFKEPQAARRPGGRAKRRGGPGGGGGRGGRSGVEGRGWGAEAGETGVSGGEGSSGGRVERREGVEGEEGRSRAARAASEPESWSCRSPATPACALPLRPRASGPGRPPRSPKEADTSPERRSGAGDHHLSERGRRAEKQPRTSGGRRPAGPPRPENRRLGARAAGRDKGAGQALPAAARSGRGAGREGGGGAARGCPGGSAGTL